MASADKALQLVQSIYDVALERDDWPSVIRQISAASGGHSGLLRLIDCRSATEGFVAAYGYDNHYLQIYRDHFIHHDPYRDHLAAAPVGALLSSDTFVPLTKRQHTEYWNDYEKPQDRTHALGSPLARDRDFMLYLGLSRGRHAGPYDEGTLAFLRGLLPHMLRSVQIQRLIGSAVDAQRLSEAALDRLRIGVLLMDSGLHVRFANAAALELARVFSLNIGESGLVIPGSRFNDRLQKLLNSALATSAAGGAQAGGDLTYSRPCTGTLQLRVFPLLFRETTDVAHKRVQVAVFMLRPGPQTLSADEVAIQFGLTAAESRLAVRLAEGKTVAQVASTAGISVATARTHLRNIFEKTATSRQSELTLLLLTSLAGVSTDSFTNKEK